MSVRCCLAAIVALVGALAIAGCGGSSDEDATAGEPTTSLAPAAASGKRLSVAATGDLGMEEGGIATLEAMADTDPDLYLALGDLSYAGPDSAGEYCELVHSKLGAEAPFEIVSGNHEEDGGEDGPIAEFAECLPDRLGAEGEYARQYYLDVGGLARLIMISPDLTIDGQHYYYGRDDSGEDTPELAWLKDAIQGAREDGIRWVVVGMHKNCISVGEYYCDVYQDLFNTLIEEDVDLVMSGHDHTYQRSKQIAVGPGCPEVVVDTFDRDCVSASGAVYDKDAGTTFVVSGAGGAELYRVHSDDPEARYFEAVMGRNTRGHRSGFSLLDFSPDRLAVRFVGSTPGTFTDRFAIEAGG